MVWQCPLYSVHSSTVVFSVLVLIKCSIFLSQQSQTLAHYAPMAQETRSTAHDTKSFSVNKWHRKNPFDRSLLSCTTINENIWRKALRGRLQKEAVPPESSRRRARSTSKRSKRKPPCNGILSLPKVLNERRLQSSQREKCACSMHRQAASQTSWNEGKRGHGSIFFGADCSEVGL